jgi:amino acid transporter
LNHKINAPPPITPSNNGPNKIDDDVETLQKLGYQQELLRRMNGFSNYAVSLSIICILAGGITSFHVGYCSVGGAAIGIGWPLVCVFSLIVAATMGQIASAYPTAGGLYHWATVLGGPRWGWITGWFNFAGLVTVLAAINVGLYQFVAGSIIHATGSVGAQVPFWLPHLAVAIITFSQAWLNYCGIRWTTFLTDFSGYWILIVSVCLTLALLTCSPQLQLSNLVDFQNFSGDAGKNVWPQSDNLPWLFILGFLLPAYTITGFDASAHTAEETIGAAKHVPRGIVRSVLVSGIFGWVMLCAIVISIPNQSLAAAQGSEVFFWTVKQNLPFWLYAALLASIAVAQYICGLATVTSASRMVYAFARDGGLPASNWLRYVGKYQTPGPAILLVSVLAVAFTIYTPVYSTITLACAIFLYISYVIPTWLGFWAYGNSWKSMGPWNLGPWYRPLAVLAILGCSVLILIGIAPPNDQALYILIAFTGSLIAISLTPFGKVKLANSQDSTQ